MPPKKTESPKKESLEPKYIPIVIRHPHGNWEIRKKVPNDTSGLSVFPGEHMLFRSFLNHARDEKWKKHYGWINKRPDDKYLITKSPFLTLLVEDDVPVFITTVDEDILKLKDPQNMMEKYGKKFSPEIRERLRNTVRYLVDNPFYHRKV